MDATDPISLRQTRKAARKVFRTMIKHVALCGAPEAGKSEVQKILARMFHV